MFKFWKKKETLFDPKIVAGELFFTRREKAAILGALSFIASSDNEPNQKELKFFEQLLLTWDIKMDDPDLKLVNNDNLLDVLNALSKEQKEWFVKKVYEVMNADGDFNEKEIQAAMFILKKIGISDNEFKHILMKQVLSKTESTLDKLNSKFL